MQPRILYNKPAGKEERSLTLLTESAAQRTPGDHLQEKIAWVQELINRIEARMHTASPTQ